MPDLWPSSEKNDVQARPFGWRGADYRDMILFATAEEVAKRREAYLRKWRLKCKAVAESRR